MCEWQRRLCRGYSDLHDVLVVEPAVQVLAHAEDLVGLGLGFGRIVSFQKQMYRICQQIWYEVDE